MMRISGYHVQDQDDDMPLLLSWKIAEPLKLLPVGFICGLVMSFMYVYVAEHAWPMIRDTGNGKGSFFFFSCVATMWWACYLRCVFTHPGSIPDLKQDPSWQYPGGSRANDGVAMKSADGRNETKRTGERRHCKWCAAFKPDRCHHCRVCRSCVLKMDHHCPWIHNCVGFRNYKFFYLLLLYSSIACLYMGITMFGTARRAIAPTTFFTSMFLLFFGETMLLFFGVSVTFFFFFHTSLVYKAMTTIEFCEKQMKTNSMYDPSMYDRGAFGNFVAVLGSNRLLWLLPVGGPDGDGLNLRESSRLHNEDAASQTFGNYPTFGKYSAVNLPKAPGSGEMADVGPRMSRFGIAGDSGSTGASPGMPPSDCSEESSHGSARGMHHGSVGEGPAVVTMPVFSVPPGGAHLTALGSSQSRLPGAIPQLSSDFSP